MRQVYYGKVVHVSLAYSLTLTLRLTSEVPHVVYTRGERRQTVSSR